MRFSHFPVSAFLASAVFALLLPAVAPKIAHAQVVAPNALTAVEGDFTQSTLNNSGARTFQTQIAASQLSTFAVGDQISGLSFRLDNGSTGPASDLTFASYQVTLSGAANAIGSFSNIFADNIGANAATVYNNALTFTAASYSSGAAGTTPNAFGPTINFSSAYLYQGGDLVITIRHSGNGVESPFLDATSDSAQGYGTAVVGAFSVDGQNATTATDNGFTTVVRLNGVAAAAAPEPSTLPLLGMGLTMGAGLVGTIRRRKAGQKG